MSKLFEELDYRETPIGPISLRRRRSPLLDVDVFEVILGEEHLMSSLYTASEIALAKLALQRLDGDGLDIVVGGLGLGYTAGAVLEDARVASLEVVELLEAVIDWHMQGLVPLDPPLISDKRCKLVRGDFFAMARAPSGFSGRAYDAILIDIDHTPDWLLDPRSKSLYTGDGLQRLAAHIKPRGIMGLWSDAQPDEAFIARLAINFAEAWAEPVTFETPLREGTYTQTVYLARTSSP